MFVVVSDVCCGRSDDWCCCDHRSGPLAACVFAMFFVLRVCQELTALRLRHDNNQKCLVQVELELKKEKGSAPCDRSSASFLLAVMVMAVKQK